MRLNHLADGMDRYLFQSPGDHKGARAAWFAGTGLFCLAGLCLWIVFMNSGNIGFKTEDWQEKQRAMQIMQEAVQTGTMPYEISGFVKNWHPTTHFLSMPHLIFSPQVFLLRVMDIGHFYLANLLGFYLAGCAGCLMLARRRQLSLFATLLFLLLFNFNGHIVSHLSVGHTEWHAYFLYPFFIYYALELCGGRPVAVPALAIGMIHFVMMMQGAFHFMIWDMMFLGLMWLFRPSRRMAACVALVAVQVALLTACRVWPAALTFGGDQLPYISSYPSLATVYDAMASAHTLYPWSAYVRFDSVVIGWWEYDLYVSEAGVIFLILFGLAPRWRDTKGRFLPQFDILHWPMLALLMLSIGSIYYVLFYAPRFPIIGNAERAPSRFIILPALFLITLACLRFQRFLDLRRGRLTPAFRGVVIMGALYMAIQMLFHAYVWRVANMEKFTQFPATPDLPAIHLIPPANFLYVFVIKAGLWVTGLSLAAWAAALWRYARREARLNGQPAVEGEL